MSTQTQFNVKPLMIAYMICTMSMMSFASLIGPIAHSLQLAPWQAGTVITVGGVLWMLLSRPWGLLSDRRGRRNVLLIGVGGFMLAYWAMNTLLIISLEILPATSLVFIGLMLTRGAIGIFFAAIPATGQALVADNVPAHRRAATMASIGAANAVGMVVGPALAAWLAAYGLGLPLYITAVFPLISFIILWLSLDRNEKILDSTSVTLSLTDSRLRKPMIVAFSAMFSVTIAQMTVGFFALDRLGLAPAPAAQAAGLALTLVGFGLIAAQIMVVKLNWTPIRLIRVGALISAVSFAFVSLATTQWALMICFFFAAAGMGWVFPAFSALAANAVQPYEQGAAAGSIGAAQGLGITLGPLIGTILYEFEPGVPYVLIAVLLALVASFVTTGSPTPKNK